LPERCPMVPTPLLNTLGPENPLPCAQSVGTAARNKANKESFKVYSGC
jgi:hypothetical protein